MERIRTTMLLFACLLYALPAIGQPGSVRGRATEAGTVDPVPTAVVVLTSQESGRSQGGYTDERGNYLIENIPSGRYTMSVSQVGYRKLVREGISIAAGQTLTLDVELEPQQIIIDGVVVTASRGSQKVLEAPASVSVVDARQIAANPALTPTDHLKTTAGVDIARTGLLQQNVVVRGFNNVFSGTLMMLTDNRMAGVPSLRLNAPYLIPLADDDIDYIEVVRGPGSALYGPNAANGVVNMITKSPFSSQGTSLSLAFGERSVFQTSVRHAQKLSSSVGVKISGLYFRGTDWSYTDPVEDEVRKAALAAGARADTLKIGKREELVERFGGEARVDLLLTEKLGVIFTAGLNRLRSGIEMTDIGSAQGKDWTYTYLQGRLSYGDAFVQAFLNSSNAGDTYLLRTGNPIVDRSSQFVAQAQHSMRLGEIQRFVYGADYIYTKPVTDGTINGSFEQSDNVSEYGGYLQSETQLFGGNIELVLAGRYDRHSQLNDPIFSPRAGLVWKSWEKQSVRLTYNKAYATPTSTELFLDIQGHPNPFGFPSPYEIQLRAIGVPKSGYKFERDASGAPFFYSPFAPSRTSGFPTNTISLLWPAVVQILAAQGVDISRIPAPQLNQIRPTMGLLNTETQSFVPVADVYDLNALDPTITETIEIGYKGALGTKLQLGVDLYRSEIRNFIAPLMNFTPNVFMNGGDVKAYLKPYIKGALMQQGVPEAQAEAMAEAQSTQIGTAVGRIPLGTVTPKGVTDPTAIYLSSRSYGKVNVAGLDLWADYRVNNQWSFSTTYSHVNRDYFDKLEGIEDVALNAPRNKWSLGVEYQRQDLGLQASLKYRGSSRFRMHSGVYDGFVAPADFFDLTVGYRLRNLQGLGVTLSAQNLANKKHQYFIGAPRIGRLVLAKISYTL